MEPLKHWWLFVKSKTFIKDLFIIFWRELSKGWDEPLCSAEPVLRNTVLDRNDVETRWVDKTWTSLITFFWGRLSGTWVDLTSSFSDLYLSFHLELLLDGFRSSNFDNWSMKKKIDNNLQPLLQQSNIMNFLPVEKKRTRGSGVLLLWFFLETCSSSIVQPCACICTKSLAKLVNPIKYEHTLETSSLPAREF